MTKSRDVDLKILSELMKNSKIPNRTLADRVGVSQPTATRIKAKLEKEKMLEYTAIPNFAKLGFEIIAFSFYSWTTDATSKLHENKEEIANQLSTFLSKHKNIIFTSNGQGFGMERMMISVHVSYSDYVKLKQAVHLEWGDYLNQTRTFVISTLADVRGRRLSFRYLAEYITEKLTMT